MRHLVLLAGAAALAAAGPTIAKPGQGHGNSGHGNKAQSAAKHGKSSRGVVVSDRFGHMYALNARGGCPPGLAKKNNGCLPPGQAKKLWAIGQPLPGSVMFYNLPGALLGQLTPAPAGYQYVQVASDILLMAIGTRMIAAAIADLSAM